ncbi:hypothetical protein M8330_11405 [Nocardioides sp. BSK12Z-4]|uniref:Uncharacterized protein n=1 Tax=Nocardioides bruguierae TaxID=2945102 RepID=A0A9X2D829_9ACTN|nr:hypothetical protein [Nocardioides bruguierae]MCM0620896.1 hypothetical protein [Nocardioides bruguierae]
MAGRMPYWSYCQAAETARKPWSQPCWSTANSWEPSLMRLRMFSEMSNEPARASLPACWIPAAAASASAEEIVMTPSMLGSCERAPLTALEMAAASPKDLPGRTSWSAVPPLASMPSLVPSQRASMLTEPGEVFTQMTLVAPFSARYSPAALPASYSSVPK